MVGWLGLVVALLLLLTHSVGCIIVHCNMMTHASRYEGMGFSAIRNRASMSLHMTINMVYALHVLSRSRVQHQQWCRYLKLV